MHNINYVDEFAIIVVFLFTIYKGTVYKKITKISMCYAAFIIGYILYSLYLKKIVVPAIFQDALQESKPFIVYFSFYGLLPKLDRQRKKDLNYLMLVSSVFCTIVWLIPSLSYNLLIHPAYYGKIMIVSSVIYLFTSSKNRNNIIIFFLILSAGLICGRSKYYGEVALAAFLFIFLRDKIKIRLKYFILSVITLVGILFVTWSKISTYLNNEEAARTVLYLTSFQIFKDYFPFGTGLGSFGEDASKVYYSPIYSEYGIDRVFGLSVEFDSFIADTYYPVIIGQFGLIGIVAFIYFIYFIIKELQSNYSSQDIINYKLSLFLIGVLLIESVASPTFMTSLGASILATLAFIMSEMKHNKKRNHVTTQYPGMLAKLQ